MSNDDKSGSITPRTDALRAKVDRVGYDLSVGDVEDWLAEFGKLERELAEANARTDACEAGWAEDTADTQRPSLGAPEVGGWLWEYVGTDPYPKRHSPVARSIEEMDPKNPPYPDTWMPLCALYVAPPSPLAPINNDLTRLIDAMHDEMLQASSPQPDFFDTWMRLKAMIEPTSAASHTLTPDAKDAARYLFLRTNYPRMIISICCGTFQGQTIEEAESRLDKSIGSDAAMAPTDDTTKGSAQ